ALDPSRSLSPATRPELYNTERKQTADGLASLPKTYAEIPVLGPPVPGDLGRAFVAGERQLGLQPPPSDVQLRPNPEDEAERAERIRRARVAQQARESGLFFRLSDKQKRMPQNTAVANAALPSSPSLQAGIADDRDPLVPALARSLYNERSGELLPL